MMVALMVAVAAGAGTVGPRLEVPLSQTLLQQVREALRVEGSPYEETRVTGKLTDDGVEKEFVFDFLPNGRFEQRSSGALGDRSGFDGRTYWKQDHAGLVDTLDFSDRDLEMTLVLLRTDNWAYPGALVDLAEQGDSVQMKLKDSGQLVDLRIDPQTHLPTEADFGGGDRSIKVSGWKPAGDRLIPMQVEVNSDEAQSYSGSRIEPIAPANLQAAVPTQKITDTTFNPNLPPTIECRYLGRTHIAVHPLNQRARRGLVHSRQWQRRNDH